MGAMVIVIDAPRIDDRLRMGEGFECVDVKALSHALTEALVDDVTTAAELIHTFDGCVASATGDAAYDSIAFYDAAAARGASVVVPPTKTARVSRRTAVDGSRSHDPEDKKIGRRRWKKESGYHRQVRVENAFFRYKSIIGHGLRTRSPAGQRIEAVLACKILNQMTQRGRPVSYSIGR